VRNVASTLVVLAVAVAIAASGVLFARRVA
jgi:hypothetical protein